MSAGGRFGLRDSWTVPAADRPVRGRVRVTTTDDPSYPPAFAGAVFATAAVITGGTVLVRNWPTGDEVPAAAARRLFAATGSYVVRSADGLTVTSRATSGELRAIDVDLSAAPSLVPLAAVLAAAADGRSSLRGVAGRTAAALISNLRAVGVETEVADGTLAVERLTLRPGRWDGHAGPAVAAAGVLLGLLVPGIEVTGVTELRRVLPGFEHDWLRLLAADEYLIPGSAKLPHEYL